MLHAQIEHYNDARSVKRAVSSRGALEVGRHRSSKEGCGIEVGAQSSPFGVGIKSTALDRKHLDSPSCCRILGRSRWGFSWSADQNYQWEKFDVEVKVHETLSEALTIRLAKSPYIT